MFIIRISFAHTTPKPQKGAKRVEEQNRRSGRGRRVKLAAVYLLAALAAALGWLNACLPDRVYLEPEQALVLPRFGWVEPLRLHGSQNVVSTRAVGSYQTTLALGGWLPVKTIRTVVTTRPSVTVCGTPFGVKMFSRGRSSWAFPMWTGQMAAPPTPPRRRACTWEIGWSASEKQPQKTMTP